eukprot:4957758-Amphidinium_carterae.1
MHPNAPKLKFKTIAKGSALAISGTLMVMEGKQLTRYETCDGCLFKSASLSLSTSNPHGAKELVQGAFRVVPLGVEGWERQKETFSGGRAAQVTCNTARASIERYALSAEELKKCQPKQDDRVHEENH